MSEYNKLNVAFANYGLNIAHDPKTLPFGKFSVLTNAFTNIEGQLTARQGMLVMNAVGHNVAPIIGIRRLSDAVLQKATYIVRTDDGQVYYTTTGGIVTVDRLFDFTSGATGLSDSFGSITIDRTSRSNQIWAYVGDKNKMVKLGIDGFGTVVTKSVGITRPTGPPGLAQSTTGGALTLLASYSYRYTLYDNFTGVESLYNAVDTASITLSGANDTVTVTIPNETVDPAVTHARIYRTGGSLAVWSLLGQVAYTGASVLYVDQASDITIASADLLDTISDKPFTTTNASGIDLPGQPLPYLFGPVNGYMLGCGDPQNPGYAYWANKFDPDSENPENRVEVSSPGDPIMNGFVYDGKAYIFTKNALYQLILGLSSSTWTPFITACAHGLMTNNAFCIGPEIYFLGKEGIYATSGSVERILTEDELRPIFHGQSVTFNGNIYLPIDFTQDNRLEFHDNHLWFQYRDVAENIHFLVWSAIYKRWYSLNFRTATGVVYDDEQTINQLIFGGDDGYMYLYNSTSDNLGNGNTNSTIPVHITSGLITLGSPLIHKEWGALIMDVAAGVTPSLGAMPVTVTVFANRGTVQIAQQTFPQSTRTRQFISLGDTFSEDLVIDIQWASLGSPPIFYGYELLYRKDAVQVIRWASNTMDLGIPGWKIVRSGYITLISTTDVILSIIPDGGTAYNYTIPSTGGIKKKVFIPFDPIKGKMFKFILAGGDEVNTSFRLYNEMCSIHAKPWLTSIGYSHTNPFMGAEGGQEVGAQDVGSSFQGNRDGESIGSRQGAPWWQQSGIDPSFLTYTGGGATGLSSGPASGTIPVGPITGSSNGTAGASATGGKGASGNEQQGL